MACGNCAPYNFLVFSDYYQWIPSVFPISLCLFLTLSLLPSLPLPTPDFGKDLREVCAWIQQLVTHTEGSESKSQNLCKKFRVDIWVCVTPDL